MTNISLKTYLTVWLVTTV